MTTLKGLFDPQPRSQRNFLLENKRDIRAKSSSNSQKHKDMSNLPQKQRPSLNPQSNTQVSTHLESAGSRRKPKVKDSTNLRLTQQSSHRSKDESRKIHSFDQLSKSESQSPTRQPVSSSRTMQYIHQENVPFEWTEVCPSLISHSICHQGVQTEDKKYKILAKDSKILGINQVCDKREVHSEKKLPSSKPIDDESSHDHYNHNTSEEPGYKASNSSKSDTETNLDSEKFTQDCNIQLKEHSTHSWERPVVYKEHNMEGNSSHLVSDLENLKVTGSKKIVPNSKVLENPMHYPLSYQKGVVPRYLTKRKTEQALASARAKEIDPNCPSGHVVMPDSERRETLDTILKNYNDLISELNKIPVRTDTLKMKQRKIEIEKQLDKLEEGIRIFSRSKVYVKLDA